MCIRIVSAATSFYIQNSQSDLRSNDLSSGLVVSALWIIEVFVFLWAAQSGRSPRDVSLNLIRPVPAQSSTPSDKKGHTHIHQPHPALEFLSLENEPTMGKPIQNPIFGKPSFVHRSGMETDEAEMMDWEPIQPTPHSSLPVVTANGDDDDDEGHGNTPGNGIRRRADKEDWDKFGTGKQRLFPRASDETGLESLLAGWDINGGSSTAIRSQQTSSGFKQDQQGKCVIA